MAKNNRSQQVLLLCCGLLFTILLPTLSLAARRRSKQQTPTTTSLSDQSHTHSQEVSLRSESLHQEEELRELSYWSSKNNPSHDQWLPSSDNCQAQSNCFDCLSMAVLKGVLANSFCRWDWWEESCEFVSWGFSKKVPKRADCPDFKFHLNRLREEGLLNDESSGEKIRLGRLGAELSPVALRASASTDRFAALQVVMFQLKSESSTVPDVVANGPASLGVVMTRVDNVERKRDDTIKEEIQAREKRDKRPQWRVLSGDGESSLLKEGGKGKDDEELQKRKVKSLKDELESYKHSLSELEKSSDLISSEDFLLKDDRELSPKMKEDEELQLSDQSDREGGVLKKKTPTKKPTRSFIDDLESYKRSLSELEKSSSLISSEDFLLKDDQDRQQHQLSKKPKKLSSSEHEGLHSLKANVEQLEKMPSIDLFKDFLLDEEEEELQQKQKKPKSLTSSVDFEETEEDNVFKNLSLYEDEEEELQLKPKIKKPKTSRSSVEFDESEEDSADLSVSQDQESVDESTELSVEVEDSTEKPLPPLYDQRLKALLLPEFFWMADSNLKPTFIKDHLLETEVMPHPLLWQVLESYPKSLCPIFENGNGDVWDQSLIGKLLRLSCDHPDWLLLPGSILFASTWGSGVVGHKVKCELPLSFSTHGIQTYPLENSRQPKFHRLKIGAHLVRNCVPVIHRGVLLRFTCKFRMSQIDPVGEQNGYFSTEAYTRLMKTHSNCLERPDDWKYESEMSKAVRKYVAEFHKGITMRVARKKSLDSQDLSEEMDEGEIETQKPKIRALFDYGPTILISSRMSFPVFTMRLGRSDKKKEIEKSGLDDCLFGASVEICLDHSEKVLKDVTLSPSKGDSKSFSTRKSLLEGLKKRIQLQVIISAGMDIHKRNLINRDDVPAVLCDASGCEYFTKANRYTTDDGGHGLGLDAFRLESIKNNEYKLPDGKIFIFNPYVEAPLKPEVDDESSENIIQPKPLCTFNQIAASVKDDEEEEVSIQLKTIDE